MEADRVAIAGDSRKRVEPQEAAGHDTAQTLAELKEEFPTQADLDRRLSFPGRMPQMSTTFAAPTAEADDGIADAERRAAAAEAEKAAVEAELRNALKREAKLEAEVAANEAQTNHRIQEAVDAAERVFDKKVTDKLEEMFGDMLTMLRIETEEQNKSLKLMAGLSEELNEQLEERLDEEVHLASGAEQRAAAAEREAAAMEAAVGAEV